MSEPAYYDPQWWKKKKASSLARKSEIPRAMLGALPGDSFLIVTEGTVTEPTYLKLLVNDIGLQTVRIRIIPGDSSDPRRVIRTARDEARDQQIKAKKRLLRLNEPEHFDHLWAVIDTDVAMRMGFWNEVVQLARVNKVKLAQSTPCFEYWLLLHVTGFSMPSDLWDGSRAKSTLKDALGRDYSTNEEIARFIFASLVRNWPSAVVHAEKARSYHHESGSPWPGNPSTDVCDLARALNDTAPRHRKKL